MTDNLLLYLSSQVEIKEVEGHGRSLVATSDIPAGKLILIEKPSAFFILPEVDLEPTDVTLQLTLQLLSAPLAVVEHVVDNLAPRSNELASEMMANHETANQWKAVAEDTLPKLTEVQARMLQTLAVRTGSQSPFVLLQRLMLCMMVNALGPGHDTLPQQLIGLFVTASNINHSCRPNALHFLNPNNPDMNSPELVVRCISDVAAGQEISFSYTEPLQPRSERQQLLRTHYFFDCLCERCLSEAPWDTLEATIEGADEGLVKAVLEEFDTLEVSDPLPKWEQFMTRAVKVLEGHHRCFCETLLILAQKFDQQKKWSRALPIYQTLLAAVEGKVYPKGWSSLLVIHMRLYACYVALENKQGAEEEKRAVEVLKTICRGPRCGGCGKILLQPRWCSRCNKSAYCSVDCQKIHWKRSHKRQCASGGAGSASGASGVD